MDAIVNHMRLRYAVHGVPQRGHLLLVPGTGCSATIWAPELVDGLAALGFGVISYDPRDTGDSTTVADDETYTLWDLAGDAAGLIDAVTAGAPTIVVGHSLGGAVSQILAVERPDLVSRLALLAAPARPEHGFEVGPEGLLTHTTDWDDPTEAIDALVRSLGRSTDDDARWVRELFATRPLPMSTRSVRRHSGAALLTTPPTDEQLAAVRVPVLVVAGDDDLSVPVSNAHAIGRDHPTARVEIVGGMGHVPARRHIEVLLQLLDDHATRRRGEAPVASTAR